MASLFLPKGSLVVTTKNNKGHVVEKYTTKHNPVLNSNIPIFILIDNFTASAAEILSGCLQLYSQKETKNKNNNNLMVFLVGDSTFGKGSVQEIIPISNGCALKLTTMLYYLPDNRSIQAKGVTPDFLIKPKVIPSEEMKWVQDLYGKESSLKHYITEEEVETGQKPKGKKAPIEEQKKEKSWDERHRDAINKDVQIKASINLINLFHFAKKYKPQIVNTRRKALLFLKQNYITDTPIEMLKVK